MPAFEILMVGGGLGDLAAAVALGQKGHRVTILESTAKLQTIGGGIGIPPNSMRVWDYLGLLQRLKDAAGMQSQHQTYFRRYNSEIICETLATRKLQYKYQGLSIHRAQLQNLLLEASKEVGVVIEINARVVQIDENGGSPVAITKDGRRRQADLIIGADGAKSTLRQLIYPDIQLTSYYNFYRAVIDGALLESVPELAPLLDAGNFWWGPDRTVVGIPLQNKTFYSFECCHPGSTGTAGDWNKKGDVELMKKTYTDFEPAIGKVMELVKPEDLLVWKLHQLPELDSWRLSVRIILIGDGHAQAIEDSACLAECLSRAKSTSDIPQALQTFESIRKPRVAILAKYGVHNAHLWQLPDGPEQEARDAKIRKVPMFRTSGWDGNHVDEVPGLPPDPLFFPYVLAMM